MDGKITHNTSTDGQGCTTSPNDLWSHCQPVRAKPSGVGSDTHAARRGKDCGPYLSPLTHSAGATYAPDHASVYLSWLTYLTDDFHECFQILLDEFKNIDCSKTGCVGQKCSKPHALGTHGSDQSCQCDSVVHCGGLLPVLYRHGFQFYSPLVLMRGSNGSNTKRQCQQFHSQLQTVINGDPLYTLLVAVDRFLYAIRWEFFSKLSGFWTIYMCLILYTFFFLLDTLHLRSHLKLTASHVVPPLALLTTGKPLPVPKLTYIGQ